MLGAVELVRREVLVVMVSFAALGAGAKGVVERTPVVGAGLADTGGRVVSGKVEGVEDELSPVLLDGELVVTAVVSLRLVVGEWAVPLPRVENVIVVRVMVSPVAEGSPPLVAGTAWDVVKGLGPLLECSESEAVGIALLGTPVSPEEPETLLAVPVGEWSSVGETAELGEVPLPTVIVVKPPLAAGVVRVAFVIGDPGPEETSALSESPPLRPGVETGAFLLAAAELPAPEGAPVVVESLPLPSSNVAVGPVLAVDGREPKEMLLFVMEGRPVNPAEGDLRVDTIVKKGAVALGERIVDETAGAEL